MRENLGGFEFESSEQYLAYTTMLHQQAMSGELYAYSALDTYAEEKRLEAARDISVEGFLADFARDARDRSDRMKRWEAGEGLPAPHPEMVELVAQRLPRFVKLNEEAIGGLRVERARRYKIDHAVEDIVDEVAKLLPRNIDAYHYRQGYAQDTIEVPGLGTVEVKMSEDEGVSTTISEVKGLGWRIWNCRPSGVHYLHKRRDISRPSDIDLEEAGVKIQLYEDNSGIFVTKDGKLFTNTRVNTSAGRGYDTDANRDQLYRTYHGGNDMSPVDEGLVPNEGWREDATQYSWSMIQDGAIVWLAENVLKPLRAAEKPEEQASQKPEAEPFPFEKIGPLFTFIDMRDLERVKRIKDAPERAYPDERHGIHPNLRLVRWGLKAEGIPREAYDGYIYAKPGQLTEDTDLDSIKAIGCEWRRNDRLFGDNHGFAQIRPKTAQDIYVVDWSGWAEYRAKTFTPTHEELTDQELAENYAVVARTMTPVTQYDGSFKDPIIIIGRKLELDEIETLFPAPEKQNR